LNCWTRNFPKRKRRKRRRTERACLGNPWIRLVYQHRSVRYSPPSPTDQQGLKCKENPWKIKALQNRESREKVVEKRKTEIVPTPLNKTISQYQEQRGLSLNLKDRNSREKDQMKKIKEGFHREEIRGQVAEKMAKSSGWAFFLSLCMIIFSCSERRIYEEFHSFEELEWEERDTVVFDLDKLDGLGGERLIAIRYNENYPFSNCYIRFIFKDSSEQVIQNKLLNVPIFHSKSGQPMGKGFGSTYTKYDTLPFGLPAQTKKVAVVHYMRQPQLIGIEAVGFKILKP
jgi:gliding motility-associated lipoprotein GldH